MTSSRETEEYFCTRAKNGKRYFARCKSCNREHAARWYANNKDRAAKKDRRRKRSQRSSEQKARINAALRLRRKQLPHQNPMLTERIRRYRRLYVTNRYKKDPAFRLRFVINSQVRSRLRARKHLPRNTENFVERFGYTPKQLAAHLERQFSKRMYWNNYGNVWEIDHIIPVAAFELPEQIRECWALSNLRPLLADLNLEKSDQRIYLI
jgi:hypothetical protein